MNSFLAQTVSVKSCLAGLVVICTVLLSATTVFWTTEVREAVEVVEEKQMRDEFVLMKAQLTRIESSIIIITHNVTNLQKQHGNGNTPHIQ